MTTTNMAALIVSIISAAITLTGVFWQFTLYRLSGARLRVQLIFEFYPDDTPLNDDPWSLIGSRRASIQEMTKSLRAPISTLGIETARVRVTNVGRTPVSVEDIGLDIGRTPGRWLGRHRGKRRIVMPLTYPGTDVQGEPSTSSRLEAVRLEPGETTSKAFHMEGYALLPAKKNLTVRGTASAANRKRASRSPWVSAWRFKTGERTWFVDYEVTPEVEVYRALWHYRSRKLGYVPPALFYDVVHALHKGHPADKIAALIKGENDENNNLSKIVHWEFHQSVARQTSRPDRSMPPPESGPDSRQS